MIRLSISVEGPTEEEFTKEVITAHLRSHGVEAQPILIGRGRGRGEGGGNVSVGRLASEMAHLYRSFDVVTSLVDFYGFKDKGGRTVDELEALLRQNIAREVGWNEERVLPYVQMHEFEGLLFSDVTAFSELPEIPPETLALLRGIREQFVTPEDINDDMATAPSKRIKGAIPHYRKGLHGPLIAVESGLDAIRAECPRFDSWVTRLESLRGRLIHPP